jgi:hypothetical protein
MSSRRRSFRTSKSSLRESFEDQPRKTSRRLAVKTLPQPSSIGEEIEACLVDIFSGMTTGFWWRVLPDLEHDDNICVSTGVPWEQLLPLLLLGGFLEAQVRSTVSGYSFILEKWENLKMAVEAASNLRFDFSRADCNGR